MSRQWMVVYPRGDYGLLAISHVLDYEQEEYTLASLKRFEEEAEAAIYAQKLSKKSGIALQYQNPTSRLLHILDLEEEDEQPIYSNG